MVKEWGGLGSNRPPNLLQISVRSCEIHTNTDACVRRQQHLEAVKQNRIFQYLENHGKCGCFQTGQFQLSQQILRSRVFRTTDAGLSVARPLVSEASLIAQRARV